MLIFESSANEVVVLVWSTLSGRFRFATPRSWSDGKPPTARQFRSERRAKFEERTFEWHAPAAGWQWARLEVWDIATNGAFVNPVWKN